MKTLHLKYLRILAYLSRVYLVRNCKWLMRKNLILKTNEHAIYMIISFNSTRHNDNIIIKNDEKCTLNTFKDSLTASFCTCKNTFTIRVCN